MDFSLTKGPKRSLSSMYLSTYQGQSDSVNHLGSILASLTGFGGQYYRQFTTLEGYLL